jgi:hypothetical protein
LGNFKTFLRNFPCRISRVQKVFEIFQRGFSYSYFTTPRGTKKSLRWTTFSEFSIKKINLNKILRRDKILGKSLGHVMLPEQIIPPEAG